MKKYRRLLPMLLLTGLLFIVLTAALYKRSYDSGAWIIPPVILLVILLTVFFGAAQRQETVRRAKLQTTGIIRDLKARLDSDGCWYSCHFIVCFWVDGKEYKISQYTSIDEKKIAERYVGKRVNVHYDPGNPQTAWAECPQKS